MNLGRWRNNWSGRGVQILEDAADQTPGNATTAVADMDGHIFLAFDGENWQS